MSATLALGTAQFGMDYGIANKRGKIPVRECFAILDLARQEGLTLLDTASAYGDSEAVIGEYVTAHPKVFEIVSKISGEGLEEKKVGKELEGSLKRLGIDRLYGYLVHKSEDIATYKGLWPALKRFKREGLIKKIGVSLYRPKELEALERMKVEVDLVQLPMSIFDQRFKAYLKVLNQKNVEVHVRSVFLQGLYFLDPHQLSGSLAGARKNLEALRTLADKNGMPTAKLCLGYDLHQNIDHAVIGVSSLDDLKQNIAHAKSMAKVKGLLAQLDALALDDENILLPYKWQPKETLAGRI